MKIPNIKGEPILDIRRINHDRVDYEGETKSLTLRVKQPRPSDLGAVKSGATRCSKRTTTRFTFVNMPRKKKEDPPTICHYPPFKRGDMGHMFLIMMVEDHVVGFGRHYYAPAGELPMYQVSNPDDTLAECALCFCDEYQGRGLGTLYAQVNKDICRDNGADWLVGTTYLKGGMAQIRMRNGFTIVDVVTDGAQDQVRVRGRL